jgi:hypothetical protein
MSTTSRMWGSSPSVVTVLRRDGRGKGRITRSGMAGRERERVARVMPMFPGGAGWPGEGRGGGDLDDPSGGIGNSIE